MGTCTSHGISNIIIDNCAQLLYEKLRSYNRTSSQKLRICNAILKDLMISNRLVLSSYKYQDPSEFRNHTKMKVSQMGHRN